MQKHDGNDYMRAGIAELEETEIPARHDWLWRDLGTFADIPAPVQLISGLLIEGNISLFYAPPKTGKTRLLFGMLKALAPGGPKFLGLDLPDVSALLFTEEPPAVIGERVRDYAMPTGVHIANEAAALAMAPADFAQTVYQAYQDNGGNFGLIAVDAVGPFINCPDWNDYGAVKAALAPIRQLARDLPTVAFLLTHHQNKGGGSEWAGALGSTALTGNVDQLIRMGKGRNGQHTITIGGRCKPDPFPFDEPVTISLLPNGSVDLIGTASGEAGELVAEHLGTEAMTVKALEEAMGEDSPSHGMVTKAIKAMVEAGTAEVVAERGKGQRATTYRATDG